MQSIHLFEDHDHKHTVCTSDSEQHYHETDNEIDCSFLHYQFQIFSTEPITYCNIISIDFNIETPNDQPQISTVAHYTKNTSRGPPTT